MCNSVDAQPVRTTYARQWVFNPDKELFEVHPQTGQGLPMSATAQEAMRWPAEQGARESELAFSGMLPAA